MADDTAMAARVMRKGPHRPGSQQMQKSIADFIIDGSIAIDSLEAFPKVIKQFPGRPELLRMHADLLAANGFPAAAAQQYHDAARLFIESGRLLQAWVAKILQWQLHRPERDQLVEFHRAVEGTPHNGAPVDDFIQNLDPVERMAVFSRFRRLRAPAGKTILSPGKHHADLHLIVSGVAKETCYEMIAQKPGFRREGRRILWEADSFGEVYPFSEETASQPHVATATRTEMLVISRHHLVRACRKHPNIESGIIRLCRIRSRRKAEPAANGVRKGIRYSIPTRMSIEILPDVQNDSPITMKGHCRDLSVSGVSFIPDRNGTRPDSSESFNVDGLIHRQVRVTIPAEELSVAISGQIVRKRHVVVNGHKIQSLGIQFAKMPPRLRGAFFAFAESAKNADPSPLC